jgi:hypothetical protein
LDDVNECLQLDNLLVEYSDIFSAELPGTPSLLPPMSLDIDDSLWKTRRNMGPHRQQSIQKEEEIRIQTSKLLESKRIVECTEPYYSQVHLAIKPNTIPVQYRYCIDYTRLNAATKSIMWPLPIIDEMLRRIGN